MLDLKFIRENPDLVRQAIRNKNEKADVDALLELDKGRRSLIGEVESLRAQQNKVTGQIAEMKRNKEDASDLISRMKNLSETIKKLTGDLNNHEEKITEIQIRIPNIPHESVPIGNESKNEVVREWGKSPETDFRCLPHYELGENLNIIDFARGAKVSGNNFISYRGLGARLERALINFMIDVHVEKHGYTEIFPPFITRRESMFGTGQLPKLEEDMYHIEQEDLFLIPTAEVPVTNLHRDEILAENQLPVKYVAYSPCFRREAGAYGKETRGLMRIHQFNKVEMVRIVPPQHSYDHLENLVEEAEEILQLLELPYRVLTLASGDLSFAAAKCYDLEIWAPGLERWLEVSSCSNFIDFQARRANIRFRESKGQKPAFVHTLNGSGVALPRTVIGILENFQTDEGTVIVPPVLRDYMKTDIIKH
ncbi:serine--tRNA ligase [candidate division KSB1 bacterium]|nr:serine--tRNA ligase [candidate division KSB1 bacterium]